MKRIHIGHLRANPKEVIDLVEHEGRIAVVDDKGDVRAYLSAPKVETEEEQGPRELAEHFYAVRSFEQLQEQLRERVRERASSALQRLQTQAAASGASKMTEEGVEEEISRARRGRRR